MKRHKLSIVLLLGLAIILQACGAKSEPLPSLDDPIKLIVTLRESMSFAPFIIAQEEGYFAEQGLEIEFVAPPRSAEAVAALLLGGIDVHPSSVNIGMFNAMAQGEPIKMVANKGYFDPDGCTYFALSVRKDLYDSGEIARVDQLVGRLVSVKLDNFQAYIVDAALGSHGLGLSDIQDIDLPASAEIAALEEKAVEAVFHSEPDITRISTGGLGVVLVRGEQVLPNFSYGYILFGPSILEDNPEAGKRFMIAYMKGVRQYNEGKTERNLDIMEKAIELDRELLEQVCWPPITLDVGSVTDFQAWAVEKDLLENMATEEQFWDSSFIDYANDILP